MVEVLLKLAWTKHSRALSLLALPPLPRLLLQSTIIPCTGSAHPPSPAGRVTYWVPSLPMVGGWNGPFWDSFVGDSMIPGPFHSLRLVFLCPLTTATHKTCIRSGDWFHLLLTRPCLEPTEMGMQIAAEFCVVFLPLVLFNSSAWRGRETRKQSGSKCLGAAV